MSLNCLQNCPICYIYYEQLNSYDFEVTLQFSKVTIDMVENFQALVTMLNHEQQSMKETYL